MSDAQAANSQSAFSDEEISQRAYQLWQSRGCPEGEGEVDWETAKVQLAAEAASACQAASHCRADVGDGRGRGPLLRLFDRLRQRAAVEPLTAFVEWRR